MKPIQVGLLGMGSVGRGVWTVLARNGEEIERRAGRPIRITWVGTRTLAKAQDATRDDGLRAYVPGDFVAPHELGRELTEQVGACERSGEQDFGVAVAVVEL